FPHCGKNISTLWKSIARPGCGGEGGMSAGTVYRPVGRVVVRRIGADRLLVPVSGLAAQGNAVFPINETGEFLWTRLAQGLTPAQAADELAAEFAVAPADAQADAEEFAAQLVAAQLLAEADT
ncbi:MAG: PqqD family protein, partial [Kiritimatiellae bacterium]|nr:PqqD family protein [Kiritimatiellia bacterium]